MRNWSSSGIIVGVIIGVILVFTLMPIRSPIPIDGSMRLVATPTRGPVATPRGRIREERAGAVIRWTKTVSKLETAEYEIETDVVKIREPLLQIGIFRFGGESIQAHVVGTVIGRTDLSQLTISPDLRSGNITLSEDGQQISFVLPAPEITNPVPNEHLSSFNNHSLGGFADTDPALWQAARESAAADLVRKAVESGICEQASVEAEKQLKALFSITIPKIYVQTKPCLHGGS